MERIFVVDGPWYLNRVFHTYGQKTERSLSEALPKPFIGLVLKDAVKVKATHVLVAFDGNQNFRYELFPHYKASRKEAREEKRKAAEDADERYREVYECLPELRKLCARLGLTFMQHKKYEADDVAASAAVQYVKAGYEVIIGGQDKDGYQVLGPRVRMYDSSAKPEPKWITAEKAEKSKGVPVSKMIMLQTLIGDPIDDIPQIITPAKAKAACNKYGSVKAFFGAADDATKKILRAKQSQLVINRQLVTLKTDLALPDPKTLKPAKLQVEDQSQWWYAHQDLCWPKTKGLFGRRK
jgi:DNA polymerase-1